MGPGLRELRELRRVPRQGQHAARWAAWHQGSEQTPESHSRGHWGQGEQRAHWEAARPTERGWTEAQKPERPALTPQQVEKQRKMVTACLRARARGLSHMKPPGNLEELHRQVLSGKRSNASSAELTPRFSPQLTSLPQELPQEPVPQPVQPMQPEELAARLAAQSPDHTPAAQLFAQPTTVPAEALEAPEKGGGCGCLG